MKTDFAVIVLFLLSSSINSKLIFTCTLPLLEIPTSDLIIHFQQSLLNDLALDQNYALLLLKFEEKTDERPYKAMFQILNARYEAFYVGVIFTIRNERPVFDTFIQSKHQSIIADLLGFGKYVESTICPDFKDRMRDRFLSFMSYLNNQRLLTVNEELESQVLENRRELNEYNNESVMMVQGNGDSLKKSGFRNRSNGPRELQNSNTNANLKNSTNDNQKPTNTVASTKTSSTTKTTTTAPKTNTATTTSQTTQKPNTTSTTNSKPNANQPTNTSTQSKNNTTSNSQTATKTPTTSNTNSTAPKNPDVPKGPSSSANKNPPDNVDKTTKTTTTSTKLNDNSNVTVTTTNTSSHKEVYMSNTTEGNSSQYLSTNNAFDDSKFKESQFVFKSDDPFNMNGDVSKTTKTTGGGLISQVAKVKVNTALKKIWGLEIKATSETNSSSTQSKGNVGNAQVTQIKEKRLLDQEDDYYDREHRRNYPILNDYINNPNY